MSNKVVDVINKYNADHKHDDSSIVDTIMAERSNAGRKKTMGMLLDCLYCAAIDAGVPKKIVSHYIGNARKEVAHQVDDNAFVVADPQKIENCINALIGKILEAKSKITVSKDDEVEYLGRELLELSIFSKFISNLFSNIVLIIPRAARLTPKGSEEPEGFFPDAKTAQILSILSAIPTICPSAPFAISLSAFNG